MPAKKITKTTNEPKSKKTTSKQAKSKKKTASKQVTSKNTSTHQAKPSKKESSSQIVQLLKKAIHHLVYISESDEPFEVIFWKDQKNVPDSKSIITLTDQEKDIPVKETSLDDFFQGLTQIKNWYGKEEKENAHRYQELLSTLQNNLSNIKVFHLGDTEVGIYIVGQTKDGSLAGVKTMAVET